MPIVLREGPYRFFYSGDRDEPHHVHSDKDAQERWTEAI